MKHKFFLSDHQIQITTCSDIDSPNSLLGSAENIWNTVEP